LFYSLARLNISRLKEKSGYKIVFHILGWTFFFVAPLLLSPGPVWFNVTPENLISLMVRNATLMALFYTNLFYLSPVFLKRYGLASFVTLLVVLVLVVSFFNAGFHEYFVEGRGFGLRPPPIPKDPPPFWPEHRPRPVMFASTTFSSVLITIIVVGMSSLLVLLEEWSKTQSEKQEQQLQKVAAELTAMKLQISPHFLFNTLNNIRWLVRSKSDYAEEAVLKLSHLLRYILYQIEADRVDLEKEINHLTDFVELQKMRIVNRDAIAYSVQGDLKDKQIVPLLLLPLAENFFKHGDFTGDWQNEILISVSGSQLLFKTSNRIGQTADHENGIGLNNVRRRLELHYPDRHFLKYYVKDSVYYLELELILNTT
jgi:hypothetical protein